MVSEVIKRDTECSPNVIENSDLYDRSLGATYFPNVSMNTQIVINFHKIHRTNSIPRCETFNAETHRKEIAKVTGVRDM